MPKLMSTCRKLDLCEQTLVNFESTYQTLLTRKYIWYIKLDLTMISGLNLLGQVAHIGIRELCHHCHASAFRRRRHYVFGLSVRPSVRPKPEIPSFHMYMGPLVHPTNRDRFTACASVRPERFPGICWRTHWGNGLKFCMLMYLDHRQNWLDYGHGLLIFLLLAPLWLTETGQIWDFRAFPGECMEGMGGNFACWCILTTVRTD